MTTQKQQNVADIKLPYKLLPFMKYRKIGYIFSILVTALSLFVLVTKGLNWGLDFTGGTVIETTFSQSADLGKVRSELDKNGYSSAIVQTLGGTKDLMIRLPASETDNKVGAKVIEIIHQKIDAKAQIQSVEFVGPNVGKELTEGAIYGTLATLAMLLIYVGLRFEWRLAVGGIAALFHDVIVTIGIFSFLQIEIDLTFVAAILSVVGYSLNDSIVVFDRVRENFRKVRRSNTLEIIDISLSQTLSRTLMTSLTTLMVLLALLWLGGSTLYSFSLALLIGIAFGTYSSIYIAISVALQLGLTREHMIPPVVEKEGAEQEAFGSY